MAKEDLKKFIEQQNEELALIVKAGFDGVDKKFEDVDKRFDEVDKKFDEVHQEFKRVWDEFSYVHASLSMIYQDVSEIKRNFVNRVEFEDVLFRLSLIEKKLGIKSGKK